MKNFLLWAAFIGGAYVIQSAFLPLISYHGIGPDLLLLLVVSFSFLRGVRPGIFMGFLVGLLQDLATGTFFGMDIFSKMLVGACCGAFSNRVFKEQFFLPIFSSLAATMMNYLSLAVVVLLLGYRFNPILHLQMFLLPMLCYNVLFAWPMHLLVHWVCDKTAEKK